MVSKRLLVVNGHPDPRPERFCAALCEAYAAGARAGGWEVARLAVGTLNFAPPADVAKLPALADAVAQIRSADRLLIVFPLWLDGPPGSLRELFELFARSVWESDAPGACRTAYEKPARVIVTMDMPAFIQRAKFEPSRAGALGFPGVQSFEPIYIGSLQTMTAAQRAEWLEKIRLLGKHEE